MLKGLGRAVLASSDGRPDLEREYDRTWTERLVLEVCNQSHNQDSSAMLHASIAHTCDEFIAALAMHTAERVQAGQGDEAACGALAWKMCQVFTEKVEEVMMPLSRFHIWRYGLTPLKESILESFRRCVYEPMLAGPLAGMASQPPALEELKAVAATGFSASSLPEAKATFVTLVFTSGERMSVPMHVMRTSETLLNLYDQDEGSEVVVPALQANGREIENSIVRLCLEYSWVHSEHPDIEMTEAEIREWDAAFTHVDDDTLFSMILVANTLSIKGLLDLSCKQVADHIKACKTPQEIRRRFNIKNDFTPEEEEEVRKENAWCEPP